MVPNVLRRQLSVHHALILLLCLCLLGTVPLCAAVTASMDQVRFLGPDAPDSQQLALFRMHARVTFSAPVSGQIVTARVNDVPVVENGRQRYNPAFHLFDRTQQPLRGTRFSEQRSLYVQYYTNWVSGQPYTLTLTVKTTDGEEIACASPTVAAPAGGMHPAFSNYLVLTVSNPSNYDRDGWPVTVGAPIKCPEVQDPSSYVYLMRYDAGGQSVPVPLQVLDVVSPEFGPQITEYLDKAKRPTTMPAEIMRLFEICFPADIPRKGTRRYVLYYGTPSAPVTPPAPRQAIKYTGENPGISIDTGQVLFHIDPLSGSLLSLVPTLAGVDTEYYFMQERKKPIFYNPDTWAPPMHWGHVNAWDLSTPGPDCPQYTVTQGPLAYRSFRSGTMVRSNDTKTAVTTTYFAGMPFYYESSFMEFTRNTLVNAVRNNEVVFNRGMMTHGAWPDANGKIQVAPMYDAQDPKKIFGIVASLPPDVPWLALFNEKNGVGVCLVNLAYFTGCAGLPDDTASRWSEYYISDPGLWVNSDRPQYAFAYMVRPMIYYNTVVPKGSMFHERCAVLVFTLGKGRQRFDELTRWVTLLREPLSVDVKPINLPPQ